jgi:hypothetical protein
VGDLVRLTKSDVINGAIKEIFTRAGITRNVTYLHPLTEREEKVPINTIASSHMARRTFVGNLDWFNSADGVRRIKLSFIM